MDCFSVDETRGVFGSIAKNTKDVYIESVAHHLILTPLALSLPCISLYITNCLHRTQSAAVGPVHRVQRESQLIQELF